MQINGNFGTEYGASASPTSGSTYDVYVGSCATVTVNTGGSIVVGDNNTGNNKGILTFEKGSVLNLYGTLTIHNNSKVIIEKGATLIYHNGAHIKLLGANAVLEIQGQINLPDINTTLTTETNTGVVKGFLKFSQYDGDQNDLDAQATGCKVLIEGTGKTHKVLEITDEGFYPDPSLAQFEIRNGKVEIGVNAWLNLACSFNITGSLITSNTGSSNEHQGLRTWGQRGCTLTTTEFSYGDYGLHALQLGGPVGLEITDCLFHHNDIAIKSQGKSLTITGCTFTSNATRTLDADYHSFPFIMQNCSLSGSGEGIRISQRVGYTQFQLNKNWLQYHFVGLRVNGSSAELNCNAFSNCSLGVEMREGNLYMDGASNMGGNNFRTCTTAVNFLNDGSLYNSYLYAHGGYNNFSTLSSTHRAITGQVLATNQTNCSITAGYNYWRMAVTNGNVSLNDARVLLSGCGTGVQFFDATSQTGTYAYPGSPICPTGGGGPASGPEPDTFSVADADFLPSELAALEESIDSIASGKEVDAATVQNLKIKYDASLKSVSALMQEGDTIMPYGIEVLIGLNKNLLKATEGEKDAGEVRHRAMDDIIAFSAHYRQFDSALAQIKSSREWADSSAYSMLDYRECIIAAYDSLQKGKVGQTQMVAMLNLCNLDEGDTGATPQTSSPFVSISEIPDNRTELTLYPNPADGLLNIAISGEAQLQSVTLHDLQGRRQLVQICNGGGACALDVSSLAQGLYAVQVNTSAGMIRGTVVVE